MRKITITVDDVTLSLSARRAWIEITNVELHDWPPVSLSARRAWIEINVIVHSAHPHKVALRKESVDRNSFPISFGSLAGRRSPQGERG